MILFLSLKLSLLLEVKDVMYIYVAVQFFLQVNFILPLF